jgi:hypothetical protein
VVVATTVKTTISCDSDSLEANGMRADCGGPGLDNCSSENEPGDIVEYSTPVDSVELASSISMAESEAPDHEERVATDGKENAADMDEIGRDDTDGGMDECQYLNVEDKQSSGPDRGCCHGRQNSTRSYVAVLCTFSIMFLTVGIMSSFGVFYVELLDYFGNSPGSTSLIGSINSGVCHAAGGYICICTILTKSNPC